VEDQVRHRLRPAAGHAGRAEGREVKHQASALWAERAWVASWMASGEVRELALGTRIGRDDVARGCARRADHAQTGMDGLVKRGYR
jgi:hypothetical protein